MCLGDHVACAPAVDRRRHLPGRRLGRPAGGTRRMPAVDYVFGLACQCTAPWRDGRSGSSSREVTTPARELAAVWATAPIGSVRTGLSDPRNEYSPDLWHCAPLSWTPLSSSGNAYATPVPQEPSGPDGTHGPRTVLEMARPVRLHDSRSSVWVRRPSRRSVWSTVHLADPSRPRISRAVRQWLADRMLDVITRATFTLRRRHTRLRAHRRRAIPTDSMRTARQRSTVMPHGWRRDPVFAVWRSMMPEFMFRNLSVKLYPAEGDVRQACQDRTTQLVVI